jgi:NAD(P)-dependent dehydrogenase (short-subunit alcohol dehydrogenase family)
MRHTFEVSVFGVVTVIHAMLPLLRASAAPRIVNVSSTTASLGLTSGGTDFGGDADLRMAYSSSKTARGCPPHARCAGPATRLRFRQHRR